MTCLFLFCVKYKCIILTHSEETNKHPTLPRYILICIFLSSADKPPIEELHQFLDFQLPRQWAPVFGELALGPQKKQQSSASLQFSFMGPKLYVNTNPVCYCHLLRKEKLCYGFH